MAALNGGRIRRSLNIGADEVQQVLLICFFALIPSVGGAIGSPGVEALFFARFGVEFLPYMYIALGALTMVSTLSLTASLNRMPKSRLFRLLPIVMALALVLARILVGMDLSWFYPVLWLGMYLFWTLQALFIWGVAGMLFDTRQAKRLFPHIAASVILGNALGGLITQPLVRWIGTENLLIVWSLSLVITGFLAARLTHAYDPPEVHFHRPKPTMQETLVGGGKTTLQSSLMRWLSVGTLLLAMLLFALAFPFSKAVATQYPSEDAMAGFLGVFQGVTTAIALAASLVFANRLFSKIGFVGVLLSFALIYLIGFSSLIFVSSFAILVAFRFVQQAWMMGVADTAHQALFNTVPPEKREPARMFVDGIPRQIGVALSGVMLVTVQPLLAQEARFSIYALMAAGAAIAFWRARRVFARSLAGALATTQLHIFDSSIGLTEFAHDCHAFDVLTDGLDSRDPAVRETAVEILGGLDSPQAISLLVQAQQDDEAMVRKRAIEGLLHTTRGSTRQQILLEALSDPSEEVRSEALLHLSERPLPDGAVHERLSSMLDDASYQVRSIAAGILAKSEQDQEAIRVLKSFADSEDVEARTQALVGLKIWGTQAARDFVEGHLSDPEPDVRVQALRALASINGAANVENIQAALGDGNQRVRAVAAESLASLGSDAIPAVMQALSEPRLEKGALVALQHLSVDPEDRALIEFIQSECDQAIEIDRIRNELQVSDGDDPRLDLLGRSLRDFAREKALAGLTAFGLISDRETVQLATRALLSENSDQRANGLELLEAIDEDELITPVLRMWESNGGMEALQDSVRSQAKRTEAILQLLGHEDSWLRACAAFAGKTLDSSKIKARLEELAKNDPDPLVRRSAAKGAMMKETTKPITTLPIMERILFLRQVPLFSDLSAEELKKVASIAGEHIFRSGEEFVSEGELGDEMYIIVSGEVRVMRGAERQKEVARRGPGEFVGEMAILTHEPRVASLIADGDVFALCLEQNNFEQMILEKPEIGISVMRSLVKRLNK